MAETKKLADLEVVYGDELVIIRVMSPRFQVITLTYDEFAELAYKIRQTRFGL